MNTVTPPYVPEPGSVAFKVIEFFTTNPEEQLSAGDIAAKFDKPARNVHSLLARAIEAGLLTRKEDPSEGELVYVLGKGHPSVRPNLAAHPTLPPRAKASSRQRPPVLDVRDIPIRKGVPLPPKFKSQSTDWHSLLSRLEVGDSFEVGKAYRSTLTKVASDLSKDGRAFQVRAIDAASIGCWRTA